MPNLLFIFGRGRSGTTLLSKMLNAHEQVSVAPEGFFAFSLKYRYFKARWDQATVRRFLEDLRRENRMKTWGLDYEGLEKALLNLSSPDYARVCLKVYEQYALQQNKAKATWVADKNPHYALFPVNLLKNFPGSKALFISRDYRDNILSYQQVPFDTSDTASLAYRWYYYNKQLLEAAERFPQHIKQVTYEGLAENPEKALNGICQFLEIPFDESMMTFHEYEDANFYGKHYSWFEETHKPVHTGHLKKWREKMGVEATTVADAICQPLARNLGYQPFEPNQDFNANRLTVIKGTLAGWLRIFAEKLLFTICPFKLRTFVINRYRSSTGRT